MAFAWHSSKPGIASLTVTQYVYTHTPSTATTCIMLLDLASHGTSGKMTGMYLVIAQLKVQVLDGTAIHAAPVSAKQCMGAD